jgi:V/A-type H+-transporting ATPase subunit E
MEMHSKIKELTKKIQQEGLDKANQEADRIIQEAKAEAEKVVSEAKAEAEKIRGEAKKSAEDFTERMKSEVRMSQQQALVNFRKEIVELIQVPVVKEPLEKSLDDREFMNKLLETMVKNWKSTDEEADLEVLLPKDQLESADKYLKDKLSEVMKNGLVIKEYPGIKKGFEIQSDKGHYKISLSDEAFEQFIKEHFKPRTVEFLFGGKS